MIDKEKTIKKAIAKYNYLYPVRGKRSIEDSFFSMRGETYLIFHTKDKKVHRVRAEEARVPAQHAGGREALDSIIKALNRPIIVRSLVARKPVKACLVNLFPAPGITWVSNTVAASNPLEDTCLTRSSITRQSVQLSGTPTRNSSVVTSSSGIQHFSRTETIQQHTTGSSGIASQDFSICHYEVIAPGCLPISQFTDMLPTPEEIPGEATGTFRYEVVAHGGLNKYPHHEWQPVDNRGITCYRHERPPAVVEPQTEYALAPLAGYEQIDAYRSI